MENYQFPSTYTAISGLLDDVDNSKQWNFELWHYCIKATIYTTTYVCKQRVVALLLMELLSKMRKMRTITPLDGVDAILFISSIILLIYFIYYLF